MSQNRPNLASAPRPGLFFCPSPAATWHRPGANRGGGHDPQPDPTAPTAMTAMTAPTAMTAMTPTRPRLCVKQINTR